MNDQALPPETGRQKSRVWLHISLVLMVGILAYSNTLHVPFVLDDKSSIVENHVIKSLSGFFTDAAGYNYNPRRFIGYLSFALSYRFNGLDVSGYHLVNLAVHLVTALLVYWFCALTLKTPFLRESKLVDIAPFVSLLAALLFVSHPLQTQAVTYVSQRLASLATMFYLLAMALYARGRLLQEFSGKVSDLQALPLFLLALVATILAMLTKEIAFTLPLVLALYEFSFFPGSVRKKLVMLLPVLLTIAIIPLTLLNSHEPLGTLLADIDRKLNVASPLSRGDYLLTQFCVIVTYLRLLFLPVNQNLDYDYPIFHSLFAPRVFCSVLLLAGLIATAIHFLRRSRRGGEPGLRLIAFGILWFFITLAVESSVIPIADVIFEHRVYLPSVGAFVAVGAALALATRRCRPHVTAVFMLIVALLTVATWQRNRVWRDEVTLWQDTVAKSPGKDRPHNNLAEGLKRQGRVAEAVQQVEIAVRLNPRSAEARSNLGAAYLERGEKEKALEQLQTAVTLNPNLFAARYNLGIIFAGKGAPAAAASEFALAVKLNPDSAAARNRLAAVIAELGMLDAAIEHFREAVRLQPDKAEYRKNLELALDMHRAAKKK